MTSTDARPADGRERALRASRVWHLFIVIDVVAALIIQVVLVLTGGPDPNTGETVATVGIGTRLVQTLSFFTIQSNILVLIVAATLVADPERDGRIWRVLRLDALLGITITGLVFDLVLIHYVHPSGWQLVATIGFHYIAPWATLLGWLLFGPRPRIDRTTFAWAFLWPVAWIAYTFVRGAIVDWYPYPFLDVQEIGYGAAIRNTLVIVVLALVLMLIFMRIDRVRTVGTPRQPAAADVT
ncbi:MAG: Pr6Pr family membrane protein [Candidatus Nanopelagicales bacterium]